MTTFIEDLVPDELWALVEPLLPAPPRPPAGAAPSPTGRASPRSSTWPVPCTPWRLLPARELGCGSSATCWRRLAEWADAGVFDQRHLEVLDRLGEQGRLDWSRASVDILGVRAKRWGPRRRKSSRS
jgi:transposase